MKVENHDLKKPMAKANDAVTVVRSDGKEFLIKRSLVAEHVNRGFKVKDAKDQPTEKELKDATQFGKQPAAQKEGETDEEKQEAKAPATATTKKATAKKTAKAK